MSNAPRIDIDVSEFWKDPYPTLSRLRRDTPIAHINQLGSTVLCGRDDIFACEKMIDVFSSDQPTGLMTKLMGQNMMRKDGEAHLKERQPFFKAVSPKAVATQWLEQFRAHADALISSLPNDGHADFVADIALPFSAECLKSITGLTNMRYQDMNAWSQGMIDGISNYTGDPAAEARCHEATAGIDAAIDDMLPVLERHPNLSLLSTMVASGMPMDSVRANIKLAISGGQNEPRDAIAGTTWALLDDPDQLAAVRKGDASWLNAFEEYARWISPIGMVPRRIAKSWSIRDVRFDEGDRIFLFYSSANRDESYFDRADSFDVKRDTSKSVAFGAGPHFCAGAWASRAMVAEVALPQMFARLTNLRITDRNAVKLGGWAFRGLLSLPVAWNEVKARTS
ncbi:cytochrome P450 [Tardiphaga alba]|uniref:Cytochrome P450 n=1 Tax=Tardiphaga alba TaxID=340268 RepID=A0ABX8ABU6_9BRAD|nr:cytochrome P450 [Tardiphaga alba]QUS39903.1 cytochrome P450 [Tardiphaga alba]